MRQNASSIRFSGPVELPLPTPEFVSYIKNITVTQRSMRRLRHIMLAAVFDQIGQPLILRDVPLPAAGAGELVLKVGACGICGSDLHAANHAHATFGGMLAAGTILGHEFAGEVVEINGDGDWSVGERAAGFPIFACGACGACTAGHPANCRQARFIGLSDAQGAYAEYVRVSAAASVRLDAHVSDAAGAMAEPLAVCIHAAKLAGSIAGESVLIIGAGPIGLLLASVCRHGGARDIVISDIICARAARGLALGATAVIDAARDDVREGFMAAAGRRPTIVFDAAGGSAGLGRAIDLAGRNARVVAVAVHDAPSPISTMTGFVKELTIAFAKAYSVGDYLAAHQLIASGAIDPLAAITDRIGLADLPAVFAELSRGSSRGKVIIEPFAQSGPKH
jgi:(R,R)-butanediol dehydrogenase/meso-butanediol dehydrogenase/diacetyl reductase